MRYLHAGLASILASTSLLAAPPEVVVVRPVEREITDEQVFTGRTDASTTVHIRSRDSGYLDKVLFKEGSIVKRGEILFQLDDRTRRAEVEKAQAEMALSEAKLKGAEVELQRATKLEAIKSISQEELVKFRTVLDESKASLQAVRAALETARLNLERTRIVAPIDGRIGRSNVDAGNLIKGDGDTALATIVVIDPLYVYFEVDDRSLLRLSRLMRDDKAAKPSAKVSVGADPKTSYDAAIDFIDNKVNASGNTIRVRASLPNPKGELYPGLYAKVRVTFGPARKALFVPDSAIEENSVLVVDDKNVLVERKVKLGPANGGLRAIEEGLKPQDNVVRNRQGRKAGDEIKPLPEKSPSTDKPRNDGAATPRPLPDLPGTGPALIVTATYPGANAHVVDEVVAGPIAEQFNGMEGLIHRFHSCTNDGEMRMTLLLKKGTDLNTAQVIAQNRLAVALPSLPEEVRRVGLSVRKRGVHLASVAVYSPDGSRDRDFIGAYADKQVRTELQRVSGVADVSFHGDTTPRRQLCIDIDKDRLRALGLTTGDVTRAIRTDSAIEPGIVLADAAKTPEELGNIVIKVAGEGVSIRVRDVARFEEVTARSTLTSIDGKPCVMLVISRTADADAGETRKTLQTKLDALTKALPTGIALKMVTEGE